MHYHELTYVKAQLIDQPSPVLQHAYNAYITPVQQQ